MVNLSIQKKKQGEAELCQAQVKLNSVLYQKAFVYLLSEIFLSEIEYYQKKNPFGPKHCIQVSKDLFVNFNFE